MKRAFLNPQKLAIPIPAHNADGTMNSNGIITEFVDALIKIDDHQERIVLPIVNLGKDEVFLGHDWLH